MPSERTPDLRLFFDILGTLDRIGAPYMIIGARRSKRLGEEVFEFWASIREAARAEIGHNPSHWHKPGDQRCPYTWV